MLSPPVTDCTWFNSTNSCLFSFCRRSMTSCNDITSCDFTSSSWERATTRVSFWSHDWRNAFVSALSDAENGTADWINRAHKYISPSWKKLKAIWWLRQPDIKDDIIQADPQRLVCSTFKRAGTGRVNFKGDLARPCSKGPAVLYKQAFRPVFVF